MNVNIYRAGANPIAEIPVASTAQAAKATESRGFLTADNLNVSTARGEPVEGDVPEETLRRDDALGRLIDGFFKFPTPAMPDFQE